MKKKQKRMRLSESPRRMDLNLGENTQVKPVDNQGPESSVQGHLIPIGKAGTEIYAGYYSEEYLNTLRGRSAAKIWDKMRRSDGKIKMCLGAIKNPIRSAQWEIEAADDSAEAQLHKEFIEHVLFKDLGKSFKKLLGEMLTCVDFGYSVFEEVHKVVLNSPKFGSYIGLQSLGFRAQRTIERWYIDPNSGKILKINQISYGDEGGFVYIPGEFCVVFTIDQEGDNYEGVSMLRPCYGPWIRKQTYQKLNAVGVEKYAVPTPNLEVPENKYNTEEYKNAIAVLEAYTTHESNYITFPTGWKLGFTNSNFDASKVQVVIDAESKEMVFSFLANFLELGMSGGGGSYALGGSLADFFLDAIEYVADTICETMNLNTIKRLIDLNFGPQENYPQLKASGISDKVGQEFAQVLRFLGEFKYIIPDDLLEDHLRKRLKFPKRSDIGQRQVAPPPGAGAGAQNNLNPVHPLSEKKSPITLSEKSSPYKLIGDGRDQIHELMKTGLKTIGTDLIQKLMAKSKSLPQSQKVNAAKSISASGVQDYKSELRDALSGIATQALNQARKEVPSKKNVKLSEFDDLPSDVKKKVQAQSDLLAETQLSDLEKAIYFQYQHSLDSTDSPSLIESDLGKSLGNYVDGSSVSAAAGNTVALTVNSARNAFFFDPEVIDEIASFTFTNPSPESPICQDLAGTVFSSDDPEADRYFPPLHHNCKSYIVPNLSSASRQKPIDPTGLTPSDPELEEYITLSEVKKRVEKYSVAGK